MLWLQTRKKHILNLENVFDITTQWSGDKEEFVVRAWTLEYKTGHSICLMFGTQALCHKYVEWLTLEICKAREENRSYIPHTFKEDSE